jgi:hypothetical protein
MWIAGAETKNAVFSGQKNAPSLTNRHSPVGVFAMNRRSSSWSGAAGQPRRAWCVGKPGAGIQPAGSSVSPWAAVLPTDQIALALENAVMTHFLPRGISRPWAVPRAGRRWVPPARGAAHDTPAGRHTSLVPAASRRTGGPRRSHSRPRETTASKTVSGRACGLERGRTSEAKLMAIWW